jgi:hypothetical protein
MANWAKTVQVAAAPAAAAETTIVRMAMVTLNVMIRFGGGEGSGGRLGPDAASSARHPVAGDQLALGPCVAFATMRRQVAV